MRDHVSVIKMTYTIKEMITNKLPVKKIKFNVHTVKARTFVARHGFESLVDLSLGERLDQQLFVSLIKNNKIIRHSSKISIYRVRGIRRPKNLIKASKAIFNLRVSREDITQKVVDFSNFVFVSSDPYRIMEIAGVLIPHLSH